PIMPKGLCGWGEDQERASMSKMIKSWDKDHPKRADIVFKALKNVAPSHLLDKNLFDFSKITNGPKVK
ncbi:MAG: tRNA 2-thiocytidine(32) synthetase TtcA, partial [Succinivibrio sp.]|nr:tRNA 2-thiocytidine(32) synthetase TtcA [Succinivibrio sp.]